MSAAGHRAPDLAPRSRAQKRSVHPMDHAGDRWPGALMTAAVVDRPARTPGSRSTNLERQLLLTLIGASLCRAHVLDPHRTAGARRAALLALAIGLLALVLVPGLGHAVNGSRRWLHLAGVNFQVSNWRATGAGVPRQLRRAPRDAIAAVLAGTRQALALLCGVTPCCCSSRTSARPPYCSPTGFALCFCWRPAAPRDRHDPAIAAGALRCCASAPVIGYAA